MNVVERRSGDEGGSGGDDGPADSESKIQEMFAPKKTVQLRIRRYNPATDEEPHFDVFSVLSSESTTVLEALLAVRESRDTTLQVRYSCRMALCGSCGMLIDHLPRLACNTKVLALGRDVITIEPLPNFPVVRDLVTDSSGLFAKHAAVAPYLTRRDAQEQEDPSSEFEQSAEELEDFVQFSHCITCGLCVAACPTASTDELFFGPQAIAQAFRYNADSRDEGGRKRLDILDTEHGAWRCHFAGSCSYVCPKGVDPALAIQFMRRELVKNAFGKGLGGRRRGR